MRFGAMPVQPVGRRGLARAAAWKNRLGMLDGETAVARRRNAWLNLHRSSAASISGYRNISRGSRLKYIDAVHAANIFNSTGAAFQPGHDQKIIRSRKRGAGAYAGREGSCGSPRIRTTRSRGRKALAGRRLPERRAPRASRARDARQASDSCAAAACSHSRASSTLAPTWRSMRRMNGQVSTAIASPCGPRIGIEMSVTP